MTLLWQTVSAVVLFFVAILCAYGSAVLGLNALYSWAMK